MIAIPQVFVDTCQQLGIDEQAVQSAWINLWQKTNDDYLEWLSQTGGLTENQMANLNNYLTELADKPLDNQFIIDIISPFLTEPQKNQSLEIFSERLINNLKSFYTSAKPN